MTMTHRNGLMRAARVNMTRQLCRQPAHCRVASLSCCVIAGKFNDLLQIGKPNIYNLRLQLA
jgi:hypothetical protein